MHSSFVAVRIRMQRSRSISQTQSWGQFLTNSFLRVRAERRGAQKLPAECLKLLEHLLSLLNLLSVYQYPVVSRSLRRRKQQVEDRIDECRRYILPGRREPLLPRLDVGDPSETSEPESYLAETVVLSSSESEIEAAAVEECLGRWCKASGTSD